MREGIPLFRWPFDVDRATARIGLWALLASAVLANGLLSFYPFEFDPPRRRINALARGADGSLRFSEPSIARTPGPPRFLDEAIRASALEIDLEVRATDSDQSGPARIFTISKDYRHSNLTLGQQGADLVARVRRPGSTSWGGPVFEVAGVFAEQRWRHLIVSISYARIEIRVDGRLAIEAALPAGALRSWDPDQRLALGDEVIGGRPWHGEMRRAQVRVSDRTFEMLADADLETPARGWYWPERLRRPQGWSRGEVTVAAWHLAAFLPIGFAIAGLWRGRETLLLVAAVSAGASLMLLLGKIFVAGRHPDLLDTTVQIFGGLLGAGMALLMSRRRR